MNSGASNDTARGGHPVRILNECEIRSLIGRSEAFSVVKTAFVQLAEGEATLPAVMILEIPESEGDLHVKGARLHGTPFYSIKLASAFQGNVARGLPAHDGMVLSFAADSGRLEGMLFDKGFLTDLRTGAAGALAADLLAKPKISQAAVIGAGVQGRYQMEALLEVRQPDRILVYDSSEQKSRAYASEMESRYAVPVTATATPREAVEGSDLIICTTPSQQPYLLGEWLSPGVHITAVGCDSPAKQELDVSVLARADKIVADSLEQCLAHGEIHHGVAQGAMTREQVHGELGELAARLKPGRIDESEITVADLTGVGVQDAAVANYVMEAAARKNVGSLLDFATMRAKSALRPTEG